MPRQIPVHSNLKGTDEANIRRVNAIDRPIDETGVKVGQPLHRSGRASLPHRHAWLLSRASVVMAEAHEVACKASSGAPAGAVDLQSAEIDRRLLEPRQLAGEYGNSERGEKRLIIGDLSGK